jgi:hypothetical protein
MKRNPPTPTSQKDTNVRKLARKAAGADQKIQTFNKLKVNGIEVSVGNDVALAEVKSKTAYARINKIFKGLDGVPMVNITWYYKPSDIFGQDYDFFGKAELITSEHTQDTPVYSIMEKIRLISFAEYHA